MISVCSSDAPIAVPGTGQRMTFLGAPGNSYKQAGQQAKDKGGLQSHLTSMNAARCRACAFAQKNYGMIMLVRSTLSASPTSNTGAKLLSWQTYSNSSWPAFHRMVAELV